MLLIPLNAGSDSPESRLRQLNPFNSDSLATVLATHYSIQSLLPYLQSANPLVLQTIQRALAQIPDFPIKLSPMPTDPVWQLRGLLKSAHYYCIRYPEKSGLLPFSRFYPLIGEFSDPIILIPLADLFQFDHSDSSRVYLRFLAHHAHPVVRRYAVHSLCILADPIDRPLVQSLTDSDDFYIRFTARNGLQRFQGEKP